jgi:glycine oxidase
MRDNLPTIENKPKLTRINGLYRHGYLLAPAIVEEALSRGFLEAFPPHWLLEEAL